MNVAWHTLLIPRRVRQSPPARGFTLLETLLSVVVLGLTALLVFFVADRVRQQTRCRQWASDLQAFATVFSDYRARNGRWPETEHEVAVQLAPLGWNQGSPFGGDYDWKPPAAPDLPGTIALTAFHPRFPLTLTAADLVEIDHDLDDGNPATGRFHTGFNGWPVYQVVKKP